MAMLAAGAALLGMAQTNPARDAAIRATMSELSREHRTYGQGDWNKWFEAQAPFRAELRTRISAVKRRTVKQPVAGAMDAELLKSKGELPWYVQVPIPFITTDDMDGWLEQRNAISVVSSIAKWFRKQNIDLIFVPVPTAMEVYSDRFVDSAPADHPASPQLRKLLFEFLRNDVETIDLLPAYLKAHQGAEPLYYRTDPHWTMRAQALAAHEIANRLKRYDFVRQAGRGAPRFRTTDRRIEFKGFFNSLLTPEEQAGANHQYVLRQVATNDGKLHTAPEGSPIVIFGDSYSSYTEGILAGTSIDGLVAAELNQPVSRVTVAGHSADAVKEFMRDPDLRKTTRVAVWVIGMRTIAQDVWPTYNFPNIP